MKSLKRPTKARNVFKSSLFRTKNIKSDRTHIHIQTFKNHRSNISSLTALITKRCSLTETCINQGAAAPVNEPLNGIIKASTLAHTFVLIIRGFVVFFSIFITSSQDELRRSETEQQPHGGASICPHARPAFYHGSVLT